MATIAVGALLGWAFSGALIGWGLVTTAFGAIMLGASLGSLFVSRDMGDFSSSPTYSFGPISNTMSQLVPIPVIYGRCRVAGNIIYQVFSNDKKEVQDIYILVGEGPVTAINSVLANDQNPASLDGCSISTYLNTDSNTHDRRDPSGARPYPNDVALACLTLKAQEKLSGTPTITSIVDGVKVWTPSGFVWSRNPVWIILDILCHPRYGMGYGAVTGGVYQHPDWERIDYASAVAAAAYCDGGVSYGARFMIDFTLDTQRPIRDVLADFLASCRGYMVETDKLQICIDAPVSIYSREITPNNIVEGSFTFWQASDQDVCNRITVDWIDPDNSYERVTDVFQDSADIADRGVVEKSISMLPVTRSGQVGHMGYYLLKTSLMVRNFCSFGVGLKDCDIQPGEVLQVTFESFTGWNKKPFRVVSVKNSGQDVMTVTCSEYIADVYDDSVLDITHHIDTSLTTNYKPDDVTEMAITEQLETLQDGSYNLIAKISWTPPASYSSLELWYRYSSEVSWKPAGTLPRGSEEYYLPCTEKIGDTLYVKIYVVSRLGVRSDGQTTSKILRGDLTPPAPPTNLQGVGGFRMASLSWADPGDGDLDHIDIYRSFGNDEYAKIGAVPRFAEEYIDNNLGVLQTAWYKLRAVDVAKNESVFGDVISVTGEALRGKDIPDQSIQPSKFIPALERVIADVNKLANAGINNAVVTDNNRNTAAVATQELTTHVNEGLSAEATARTTLAVAVNKNTAAVQTNAEAIATVDGKVEAKYTIVVDANGKVAGIVLGTNGTTSEFAILAEHFYVANPVSGGEPIQVFSIDSSGDTPKLVMNGNLFVNAANGAGGGWIVGDMISAAAQILLGAGGAFIGGEGSIFQLGTTDSGASIIIDSETGTIKVIDPTNLTTGDFIKIESGSLATYKYLLPSAGSATKSAYAMRVLRAIETGYAGNGATVTLGNRFPTMPNIMVSPRNIVTYIAGASGNQQMNIAAANATYNSQTGIVTFVPVATLTSTGSSGSFAPSSLAGYYQFEQIVNIMANDHPMSGTFSISLASATVPAGTGTYTVAAEICAMLPYLFGYPQTVGYPQTGTCYLYLNEDGIDYLMGTTPFITAQYVNTNSEPGEYYTRFSITRSNYGTQKTVFIKAVFYVGGGCARNDITVTNSSIEDYIRGWARFVAGSYNYPGTTLAANGTLNYIAIA